MTLHISLITGRFVLQVSDRLVSVPTRRGPRPHERTANKTVIYFARDAYVSISYTGLAYLDERTTDQWIAEKLIGEEVESWRGPSGGISQLFSAGPMPRWLDIGAARHVLRRELIAVTNAMPTEQRPNFPQLFIAGWQRGKRVKKDSHRWRPIAHIISDEGVGAPYTVCPSAPRQGWERGRFLINYTPEIGGLVAEQRLLFEYFKSDPASDDAEKQMASLLRRAADGNPGYIGKDYLSVLLPPPSEPHVRTRYVAFDDDAGTPHVPGDNAQHCVAPVGYSPWVVHPYYRAGPAIRVGSQSWEIGSPLGTFEVRSENTSSVTGTDHVVVGFESQPRKPPTS